MLVTGVGGVVPLGMSGKDPLDPELSSVGVPVRRRCDFSSSTAANLVSVMGGDACRNGVKIERGTYFILMKDHSIRF